MKSIRAVLFDADGVIQDNTDDLPERLERTLGFIPDDIGAFIRDVVEAERPALTNVSDFSDTLQPVLHAWDALCGVSEFITMWSSSIVVSDAILALISKLRQGGMYCAIASTQQRYRAEYMSNTLGYGELFDDEFYACHLEVSKPDPAFFVAVLAQLPFTGDQTLFIDDVSENVLAAQSVGLHAERFVLSGTDGSEMAMRDLLRSFSIRVAHTA